MYYKQAGLTQTVECHTRNMEVVGSIPATGPKEARMKCSHSYMEVSPFISECYICGNRKVNKKRMKEQNNGKARNDS